VSEPAARVRAFVALGSNLGDRAGHLARALAALRATPAVSVLRCSRLYETDPVGPPPQGPYLNAVAELETSLPPRALLGRLLAIEAAEDRVRGPERNAPRTLDLDLLAHGDAVLDEPGLQLPHPRLHERAFVLTPLCDLAPGWRHPLLGVTASGLLAGVRDPQAVRPFRAQESQAPPARRGGEERAMAIVAVSISPVGAGVSVGEHVAEAIRVLRDQDRVRWELGPMFTTLEGDSREIFELILRMQEAVFAAGAVRVGTVIKVDERRDREAHMEDKVRHVEESLAVRRGG